MARLVHVLVLQLLLAFTALTEPDVFVEEEHEAVLTCDTVQVGQDRCDTMAWLYNNPKISNTGEEFITLGKQRPDSRFKDQVTLTENCSLIIKNTLIQQHGFYTCKQYDESLREVSEASLMLSVVSLTEHVDSVEVRLNCYMSSPHSCQTVQVNLLYNGTRVETDHTSATVRSYACGTTVSFRPEYFGTKRSELFSCEISLRNKRYLYKLRDKPTEEPMVTETEPNDNKGGGRVSPAFSGHMIRNALLIAGLVTLLLSVAAVQLYARVKGRGASERSRANVTRGGAVVYENVAEPSVSVRFHSQPYEN